jgi:hypothetical protein
MPRYLTGPRLKLKRASYHLNELQRGVAAFLQSGPYEAVAQDNPETGMREARIRVKTPVPPALSAICGDVVHNLRAALDHLAGQLVIANSGQPDSNTEFPIGQAESHYEAIRDRKAKGFSKAALDILDGLKPYKGGNDALWRVHQLDIVDKHRLLLTVAVAADGIILDPGAVLRRVTADADTPGLDTSQIPNLPIQIQAAEKTILTDGVIVYSAPTETYHHNDVKVVAQVSLAEPGIIETEPISPTLHQLVSVVDETINLFEPLVQSPS